MSYFSSPPANRIDGDCPCGSGRSYGDCCRLYHTGKAIPVTAEALMRSRYAAYFFRLPDYLYATTHPDTRSPILKEELENEIHEMMWRKLTILSTSKGKAEDKKGKVKFAAQFHQDGELREHQEHSRFKKFKGTWKYLDARG